MSREKQVVLEALGAEIIRTPTEAAWDAPESHIGVAKKLQKELPNAHILDQYSNPSNPKAHYDHTAQEIFDQMAGKVDMVVIGAGTGGTISGAAQRLKELNPNIVIVGADPIGSILAGGDEVGTYKVEGIGYDFIPDVLDRSLVDRWVKTADRESFLLARRLIKEEGLLCGGSSGSALFAAFQEAVDLGPDQNCVVLLPDGVRNYMTKFVDDKWMAENRFLGGGHIKGVVSDLMTANKPLHALEKTEPVQKVIALMKAEAISQVPVTDNGVLCGIATENDILQFLGSGEGSPQSVLDSVMHRGVATVRNSTPIGALQEVFGSEPCAVVVNDRKQPIAVLTKIDLVDWLATRNNDGQD